VPPQHNHHNLGGSNKLISLAEAARRIDVEPHALRRHRGKWGIPWLKVGQEIKFRERDIDAWIAQRVAAA